MAHYSQNAHATNHDDKRESKIANEKFFVSVSRCGASDESKTFLTTKMIFSKGAQPQLHKADVSR
jgi:hypothetical protein